MPLQCNIDARGKVARLIWGLVLIAAGIVMIFAWARGSDSIFRWILSLSVAAGGAFACFEAWAGWCVIRAMGMRTPM